MPSSLLPAMSLRLTYLEGIEDANSKMLACHSVIKFYYLFICILFFSYKKKQKYFKAG